MAALIDTGIFFGYYSLKDEHHMDSVAIVIHAVEGKWGRLYVTNHILDETLTLMKYKSLPVEAFIKAFVDSKAVHVLNVDKDVETKALELFRERLYVKGFSFTDAVSEVIANDLDMVLLSYDGGFGVETVGRNYWISLDDEERKRIISLVRRAGVRI
jgi:predicted nucleic acid-binding protein